MYYLNIVVLCVNAASQMNLYSLQKSADDIATRCVAAEPHHGEHWCRVSKAIPNWRLKTQEILPLVAAAMSVPT